MKAFVFGIDGASFNIITPLINAGKLPNFKKIMEGGCHANLRTTLPYLTGPAWSTFSTGVNPGKHNIFSFSRLDKNHNFKFNTSFEKKAKNFWEFCKQSIIINVPCTYPATKIDGQFVTGMLTPSIRSESTYPKNLKNIILKNIPDYLIELPTEQYKDKPDKFLKKLYGMMENRFKLIKLMLNYEWKLFVAIFIGADRLKHLLWDSEEISNCYERIDKYLGELLEILPKGTNLFIVSDHGFTEIKYRMHPNSWLISQNYLVLKKSNRSLNKLGLTKNFAMRFLKIFKIDITQLSRVLPFKLKKLLPAEKKSIHKDIDWLKTKAFATGFGQIYINSEHKFKEAPVSLKEYDSFKKELKTKLEKLDYIKKVNVDEDIYFGPYTKNGPDLVIEYEDGYFDLNVIDDVVVDSLGKPEGTHSKKGVFMAYGPGIKSLGKIEELRMADVAPTILTALNIKLPDTDGKIINNIFV